MQNISKFDPSAVTSGQFAPGTVNPNGVLYLFNESSIGLQLTLPGGKTVNLPPWYVRAYILPAPGPVTWTQLYTLNSSATPASLIHGEAYESAEIDIATLPQGPLVRQATVANQGGVQVATTIANQVVDTGNAAGSVTYQARPVTAAAPMIQIDNQGHITQGNPIDGTGYIDQYPGGYIRQRTGASTYSALHANQYDMSTDSPTSYFNFHGSNGNINIQPNSGSINVIYTAPVSVTGSVSGNVNLFQYITGSVQITEVQFNNYKSAAAQTLTLPSAYNYGGSKWDVDELQGGKVEALSGGNPQTFSVLVALALTGGTQNPQAYMNGWSKGACRAAFDTIRVTSTTNACTGVLTIIGN